VNTIAVWSRRGGFDLGEALMRVGISGHQRLGDPAAWEWIREAMLSKLNELEGPITGYSCLAIGADQLFARLVLDLAGELNAVIPFAEYDRTFDPPFRQEYRRLLGLAKMHQVVSTAADEQAAYLEAGKRVVTASELLLTVWDGKPAKGKGGTGDIVSIAKQLGRRVWNFNPISFREEEL
jgi:hypothetical protein